MPQATDDAAQTRAASELCAELEARGIEHHRIDAASVTVVAAWLDVPVWCDAGGYRWRTIVSPDEWRAYGRDVARAVDALELERVRSVRHG